MTLFSDPMAPEEHDIVAAQARIAELEAVLRKNAEIFMASSIRFRIYQRGYETAGLGEQALINKSWADRLENNAQMIEMALKVKRPE